MYAIVQVNDLNKNIQIRSYVYYVKLFLLKVLMLLEMTVFKGRMRKYCPLYLILLQHRFARAKNRLLVYSISKLHWPSNRNMAAVFEQEQGSYLKECGSLDNDEFLHDK